MLIRELQVLYKDGVEVSLPVGNESLSRPADVARILHPIIGTEAVEVFVLLCLDVKHRITGYHVVSRGTVDCAHVHPRDVFKAALLANAAAVILAHNHPSGDPQPSADDRDLTRKLTNAGELLQIPVIDHVILGTDGRHYSFKWEG